MNPVVTDILLRGILNKFSIPEMETRGDSKRDMVHHMYMNTYGVQIKQTKNPDYHFLVCFAVIPLLSYFGICIKFTFLLHYGDALFKTTPYYLSQNQWRC